MNKTQFLGFELCTECNRGKEHTLCPNMQPRRWGILSKNRPMTDDQIVGIASAAVEMGFDGYVTWHYYNEPLLAWPRMKTLMERIRPFPTKFLLWTNGDLFSSIPAEEIQGKFAAIVVTNYANRDLAPLRSACADVRTVGPGLDWRVNPPNDTGDGRCFRPFIEMVFDYGGNVRTCCHDWKGETSIGNIHDTPFNVLWERWLALRESMIPVMSTKAPRRCRTCGTRSGGMPALWPAAAERASRYVESK